MGDRATLLRLLTLTQLCLYRAEASEVIADLSSGKIRGKLQASPNGKLSKQFLGIPYAKAPIGKLRFSSPEPVEPWSGVREATSYPPICPQLQMPPPLNKIVAGLSTSEDCLFLNVFAPSTADPNSKLAVMVFIHGGGFMIGGAPADNLSSVMATMDDVIVVCIQYRLGILGFFNVPGTGTKGNYGLMDQVDALKWVQRNIASFGGDPSKVTIFGESAGAVSAALLMLIPQAENSFHRVIAQSGAADSVHTCNTVENRKQANAYLDFLSCPLGDQYLECLREKSYEDILKGQLMMMSPEFSKELWPTVIMTPVVDGLYINDIPRNLLRQGKFHRVPSIFGINANEGSLVPTMMFGPALPLSHYTSQLFHGLISSSRNTPEDDNELVKAAIIQQYTKHGVPETPEIIREQLMDLWHDKFATAPTALNLQTFADAGIPGYFFIFNHRSKYSIWPEWVGVNHADELPYVFGAPFARPNITPLTTGFTAMEKGLSRFMIKLWTNFAKFGDPNSQEDGHDLVTWPKYTNENREYLEIGLEWKVGKNYRPKEVAFWNEFLPKLSAPKAADQEKGKEKARDEL